MVLSDVLTNEKSTEDETLSCDGVLNIFDSIFNDDDIDSNFKESIFLKVYGMYRQIDNDV